MILFEGILTIYFKELRDLLDMKLFVDSDSDTRLSRRGIYKFVKFRCIINYKDAVQCFWSRKGAVYSNIIVVALSIKKEFSATMFFCKNYTTDSNKFFFVINFTLTCGQMWTFRLVCFFSILYKTCRLNEFWTEFVIFDLPPVVDRCEPFGWCTAPSAFYITINDSKDSDFQVINHILC